MSIPKDGKASLVREGGQASPVSLIALSSGHRKVGRERLEVLQHFEYAVMNAIAALGEHAFPAEITRAVSDVVGRPVSLAQVFITLERLEGKGFVSSSESESLPGKNGRRRRVFRHAKSGYQAVVNTAAVYRAPNEVADHVAEERLPTGPDYPSAWPSPA